MFFHTIDDDEIPVSRIRRIRKMASDPREPRWAVELDGDEEAVIGLSAKALLDAIPTAAFRAAPGTEVLRVDEGELFKFAVIGWVIPRAGNPMPVTVDGINDGSDSDEYVDVLLPDGKVYRPDSPAYTFEEFGRLNNLRDAVITLDPETVPGLADLIKERALQNS